VIFKPLSLSSHEIKPLTHSHTHPHACAQQNTQYQCNALVMGATMAAVSEALALGKRLHVDPAILTDVLLSGSGRVSDRHGLIATLTALQFFVS